MEIVRRRTGCGSASNPFLKGVNLGHGVRLAAESQVASLASRAPGPQAAPVAGRGGLDSTPCLAALPPPSDAVVARFASPPSARPKGGRRGGLAAGGDDDAHRRAEGALPRTWGDWLAVGGHLELLGERLPAVPGWRLGGRS